MIRIIDEPVYEMTMAEFRRLWCECFYNKTLYENSPGLEKMFEGWLEEKGYPHTVLGRIAP